VIREDARSRKVAIVADYLVNPDSALYRGRHRPPGPVFDVLVEDGWGIMKPPPHVVAPTIARPAVTAIAGDAVDYGRHDYQVLIVAREGLPGGGVWLDILEAAFRELGASMPAVVRLGGDRGADQTPAEIRAALARGGMR
jgi:hypothetical protein